MPADQTVPAAEQVDHKVQVTKVASELRVGDRIAEGFLPGTLPADVLFTYRYTSRVGHDWVYVAYREDGFEPLSDPFRATAVIPVEPVDDGMGYSREADDPTPVSPARVPLHTGSVVNGNELIVEPATS